MNTYPRNISIFQPAKPNETSEHSQILEAAPETGAPLPLNAGLRSISREEIRTLIHG